MKTEQIARTILGQIGGHRFSMMTGAKNFRHGYHEGIGAYLEFNLPSNFAKEGINCVRITLTPKDLYLMIFSKMTKKNGVPEQTVIATEDDIYCDMLESTFKEITGLDTRL